GRSRCAPEAHRRQEEITEEARWEIGCRSLREVATMSVMIAFANSAAVQWLAWVVAATLDAALLLAVIGLIWLVIRNRVAPQVGYCLFLLVPLKLLVPVVVTVPPSLAQWTPSGVAGAWLERSQVHEKTERPPSDSLPI